MSPEMPVFYHGLSFFYHLAWITAASPFAANVG